MSTTSRRARAVGPAAMSTARLPWPIGLSGGAAGVLVLLVAVATDEVPSIVVRVAELVLAGGAAYLLDDAAAAVTVAVPRSFWQRRAPSLLSGGGILALSWIGVLVVLRWQQSALPLPALTGELAVLCCLAVAAAAVLVRRGEREPGNQVAPGVLMLGLTAVMAEPLLRLTIFVPDDGTGGAPRQLAWLAAGALALAVVLVASRDPAGSVRRARRHADLREVPHRRGQHREHQDREQQPTGQGDQPAP
jgi:hypothetical protein